MTSTTSAQSSHQRTQSGPLLLLANVVSMQSDDNYSNDSDSPSTRSSSLPPCLPDIASLHIPCANPVEVSESEASPLKHLNSPDNIARSDSHFVPFIRHHSSRRRTRRNNDIHIKAKIHLAARRKELLDKATKIKSLDNSPVNERQLMVLRMVYDEITMYPCESWMVLLAIIIHRAYKQVKNWFSNERQKNRTGESVPFETEDGDRVRLRATALSVCQEWSDAFFEEVVMIYNYRIQRNSRFRPSV
ncbi:hypothetical protein CVT24_006069 [Panaeolus cyanescens]|uniref:Homeobox domain-containing protein n=1 Tax=Panaeolus cyanescens TaxID=181874 RepID=A0A409V8Q7_9AGAR|nr:hypothetical protein CVT24_006069 [Panaeolus cyanescens]